MGFDSPAFTVSVALAAGMICQALARAIRMPGIVVLLLAGVLLGPEVAGIVQPDSLGPYLRMIVAAAVAVILFEGGLNLEISRIRGEAVAIRRLITVGAVVTGVLATLAARLIIGWNWQIAVLFGTLVIVTGPTVVTPLLRRIRVNHKLHTVLEAEAVLIDPIGAVIAVVALEVVLAQELGTAARGLLGIPTRLLFGAMMGLVGGYVMAKLIAIERIIPEGLESVFTLSLLVALFQLTEAILPDSGIMAAPIAGMVVGNMPSRPNRELKDFKEQLTVMLVGLLFILLAADVQLKEVTDLGWAGIATVAVLMFVIRPLSVAVSTAGSTLTTRERLFIMWLAPRGIVAAAVASLFAEQLTQEGFVEGVQLRALVFLVISATVLVQGISGGFVATLLGVRRPTNTGWVIAGVNPVARALAAALQRYREEVVVIDTDPAGIYDARAAGLNAIQGNVLDEAVLDRAALETRRGVVSVIPNEAVSLLLAQRARRDYRIPHALVLVGPGQYRPSSERLENAGAHLLFGTDTDLVVWQGELARGNARVAEYRYAGAADLDPPELMKLTPRRLPLVLAQRGHATPFHDQSRVRTGDVLIVLEMTGADLPTDFEPAGEIPTTRVGPAARDAAAR